MGLFLLYANIHQVLETITNMDHCILRNISALIIVVTIYMLWRERITHLNENSPKSSWVLSTFIKRTVAYK